MAQRIFTNSFLNQLSNSLRKGDSASIQSIADGVLHFDDSNTLTLDSYPDLTAVKLDDPSSRAPDTKQFPNAVKLYEALRITPFQASDPRLWSYLALVTFRDYMGKKRPLEAVKKNHGSYILTHYVCPGSSIRNLLLHDIALLWWIPYLTASKEGDSKYQLTAEVFSNLDYTRHLLPGTQGRAVSVRHAVLEFVVENPDLFSEFKESRIRFIMRRLNMDAGYQLFPMLSKDEVKATISGMRAQIAECRDSE
jgi:hypothetical protein